jgi:RNA polymerase sigma-32 factor
MKKTEKKPASKKPISSGKNKSDIKKVSPKKVKAEIVEKGYLKPIDDEVDSPIQSGIDTKAIATADPINLYLQEIRKYPLLTKEQEEELAKKYYETKDPEAAQALVTANLRFVVKVAAEYSKFGARLIDLVQEGNMGLMHAVREFNPYKGVRLITYAVWWIRGYIQEYLMKQYSLVKIGTTQNQKRLFYQLQKEKEALDAMGEKPDIKLIASRLNIPEDEVAMMSQRMSGRDISLDRPLDEDSPMTLADLQKATTEDLADEIDKKENLEKLKTKIEQLRPELNEREVILLEERLLNDEPLTLQEIGEKYGITREAVRQAEVRLMKKIKDKFQE